MKFLQLHAAKLFFFSAVTWDVDELSLNLCKCEMCGSTPFIKPRAIVFIASGEMFQLNIYKWTAKELIMTND